MSKVTIEYYGVRGEGRTVTEAKRNAGAQIERIVENLSPKIYAHRGHAVVIYPNTEGESYTLIHPDSEGQVYSCTTCHDARESAISSLLAITRKIGEYEVPAWVPKDMHRNLLSEWRHNDGFQLAYRHAEGMTVEEMGGVDCHHWAVLHTSEFIPK